MATIPPNDPKVESSAMANPPPNSLQAEYEAAVTAWREQITLMSPTRKEYDALFCRHRQSQTRYNNIMEKIMTHRPTYQRHKQYFISLSNALLASNAAIRSAPKPISDLQALTHATLFNDIRLASYTLAAMIHKNKRLEKARDIAWTHDQELFAKCQETFVFVDRDCRVVDGLHAKVLEVEKKMGRKPECTVAEGKCISCLRTKEREARKAAEAEQTVKEKKGRSVKGSDKNVGKGAAVEGRLEDTVEEKLDKAGECV